ncbi:MAG: ribonuclease P protein component [Alphaproteobacteria bacterium]|nr:ribonuclease P protein component [Alphaproteobacteria bacterium]
MTFETLKKRSDFLRIRGGSRWGAKSFVLEAKRRMATSAADAKGGGATPEMEPARGVDCHSENVARPRFGFTVTKKMGNAVTRNRIKRRLREAVRNAAPGGAVQGCDYVLVARHAALTQNFGQLVGDLKNALRQVNSGLNGKPMTVRNRPRKVRSNRP